MNNDCRGETASRIAGPYRSLEALGAIRERAGLGYGAGGLHPAWHGLGVPAARTRALEGVPVGGGRAGGHLRPAAASLLCGGAVERAGPDPERAPVWADGERGQPQRGRQGVLLLP